MYDRYINKLLYPTSININYNILFLNKFYLFNKIVFHYQK